MSSISDETYHLGEFEPRPDDDVVICRCEEITRGEIRRAVHAGMYTMNEVKRFLRAGMGLCQGQSCNKTVRAIIAQELGISPTEEQLQEMARKCILATNGPAGKVKPLHQNDVENIYRAAL